MNRLACLFVRILRCPVRRIRRVCVGRDALNSDENPAQSWSILFFPSPLRLLLNFTLGDENEGISTLQFQPFLFFEPHFRAESAVAYQPGSSGPGTRIPCATEALKGRDICPGRMSRPFRACLHRGATGPWALRPRLIWGRAFQRFHVRRLKPAWNKYREKWIFSYPKTRLDTCRILSDAGTKNG